MSNKWSPYQEEVFRFIADGSENLAIDAVAGSGKTTTIVEGLKHVKKGRKTLFCAFNKRIQEELSKRVPHGVECRTLHSLGFTAVKRAMGNVKLDEDKTWKLIERFVSVKDTSNDDMSAIKKLVSLAKNTWSNEPDELRDLIAQFELESGKMPAREMAEIAIKVLDSSKNMMEPIIDFDDMVWLPVECDMSIPKYDEVFVDETQDMNACQLELVKRASKTRITCVGDPRQAIYGFRGADSNAFQRMVTELGAKVLNLPVNYRCGKKIIEFVQPIVPHIQAFEGNEDGSVETVPSSSVLNALPGDFIISRTNAPLTRICLELLKSGKRAIVAGRDVGQMLAAMVKRSSKTTVLELIEWLVEYKSAETMKIMRSGKNDEKALQNLEDKCETILALSDGLTKVQQIIDRIDMLFSDNGAGRVVCSTAHKAKGLESDHVYIIEPTFRVGESEEEDNIWYVACTRAKKILYIVPQIPFRR